MDLASWATGTYRFPGEEAYDESEIPDAQDSSD